VKDYKDIFRRVENTIFKVGSKRLSEDKIRKNLLKFKETATKTFTDDGYFNILVDIPFYSGFKAATVTAKRDIIHGHFPDYKTVAGYGAKKIRSIIDDPDMIKNKRKINACVENAKTFKALVAEFGSFQKYVEFFSPKKSMDDIMCLRDDLKKRFDFLGGITSYHFLTEIGMPVLKPDRVIRRIFYRLGVVKSDGQSEEELKKVVYEGRKFSDATGEPMRYVDIIFVAYGQMESDDFGIDKGICLSEKPRCEICGIKKYCER